MDLKDFSILMAELNITTVYSFALHNIAFAIRLFSARILNHWNFRPATIDWRIFAEFKSDDIIIKICFHIGYAVVEWP